ncbi:MAG: AMP-binding protein, partial [Clostridia bacterium]|nr:AMP-binding protein [Clostridia bacterium]
MVENNVQTREVALRIRNARESLGLTEEIMAQNTDTTVSEYLAYENGEKDFDFTFIYKCAKCFNLDPTDLLKGASPTLTSYEVTRAGGGLPITRNEGYEYKNKASMFKNKTAEPYHVVIPYIENGEGGHASSHKGQEFDIVIRGTLQITVGNNTEILNAGDTIYYNSSLSHSMKALGGAPAEIYAIVMKDTGSEATYGDEAPVVASRASASNEICSDFIHTVEDRDGRLVDISFPNQENFNFAFDCVDAMAKKNPDKLAMLHISNTKEERRFTFADISKYSSQTANYFASLGIKKGDRVMLVLKRHYQFWFSILALHKLGAVVIPATNQLVEHDFDYRYKAAGVSAIVCTADGEVSDHAAAAEKTYQPITKILVGGKKDGWHDFDSELPAFSDVFERSEDSAKGSDPMLMFFTSGTTGYPKIATHNHKYPLGHYITAKYWHNVNPEGIHFTISDTGWGKALWGKLYGQWLAEAAVFVYDFDRFNADEILPMFKKYNITTFCAPPTMYRMLIKQDLSKYDLSSIHHATTAGEALNPEVFYKFEQATGLRIAEGFGQTEMTLGIANLVGTELKPGAMGKPVPGYGIDLVDSDGNPVADGVNGEIVIRTDPQPTCGVFLGYYRNKEATQNVWHD